MEKNANTIYYVVKPSQILAALFIGEDENIDSISLNILLNMFTNFESNALKRIDNILTEEENPLHNNLSRGVLNAMKEIVKGLPPYFEIDFDSEDSLPSSIISENEMTEQDGVPEGPRYIETGRVIYRPKTIYNIHFCRDYEQAQSELRKYAGPIALNIRKVYDKLTEFLIDVPFFNRAELVIKKYANPSCGISKFSESERKTFNYLVSDGTFVSAQLTDFSKRIIGTPESADPKYHGAIKKA